MVAEIQEVQMKETQFWHGSTRQRTEDTNNTTGYSLYPGTLLASYFQLLIKHGSTDFVHRNSGSQCSQHQQCVKQYRNNIPHNRHRTKCLLENIRQSDKMSEGPLSGLTPTENAAGKIINPAMMAIIVSINAI